MGLFTLYNCLILAFILFSIGIYGVLTRRNLLVVLMSLELMFNAVNIVLIAFNYFRHYGSGGEHGHYFVLLVIAVAACEAAVGLAILVAIYRNRGRIDIDDLSRLRG